MKIISLNLARKDDLGLDHDTRMHRIARFLDSEKADIICLQEVSFDEEESLANEINKLMQSPYSNIRSELSKKVKISDVAPEDRATSMRKMFAKDPESIFTDGQAIMSNLSIKRSEKILLTKVNPDKNGRPDRHTRIAQNVDFADGTKISNIHLASNGNSYQQLLELIKILDDESEQRIIVGDFNMTRLVFLEKKSLWDNKYNSSIDFTDYVSFPENALDPNLEKYGHRTLDYMLIPKNYKFTNLRTADNLSDHSAVIFEVEKISI